MIKELSIILKRKKYKKGFTLVELVVVIAILGILASIAIPRFMEAAVTAKKETCFSNRVDIARAYQIGLASGSTMTLKDYIEGTTSDGTLNYQKDFKNTIVCPKYDSNTEHLYKEQDGNIICFFHPNETINAEGGIVDPAKNPLTITGRKILEVLANNPNILETGQGGDLYYKLRSQNALEDVSDKLLTQLFGNNKPDVDLTWYTDYNSTTKTLAYYASYKNPTNSNHTWKPFIVAIPNTETKSFEIYKTTQTNSDGSPANVSLTGIIGTKATLTNTAVENYVDQIEARGFEKTTASVPL